VPWRDFLIAGDALVSGHRSGWNADMVPYTRMLSERLRLPVFSIYTFVIWFRSGLVSRDFGHPASAPWGWREG
jgi:hypothetical protein